MARRILQINKRNGWCVALLVTGLLTSAAVAQEVTRPTTRHEVNFGSMEMEGTFELIQEVVDLVPGAESPVHTHGGPEFVLVLGGEITIVLEEDGSETVYGVGESSSLPADTVVQVRNDSEQDASFVVTFVLPEGATLTTPR